MASRSEHWHVISHELFVNSTLPFAITVLMTSLPRVLFLFGSETGNSETVANLLYEKALKTYGSKTEIQMCAIRFIESHF
jgi:hypothetical protein